MKGEHVRRIRAVDEGGDERKAPEERAESGDGRRLGDGTREEGVRYGVGVILCMEMD